MKKRGWSGWKSNILMAKAFKCGKINRYEERDLGFFEEVRFLLTEYRLLN